MPTKLGSRLKQARERLGLSAADVARRAQLDRAQLHRIENADNAAPTFAAVARLAKVLDVSLNWLALGEAESESSRLTVDTLALDDGGRKALISASQNLEYLISKLDSVDPVDATKLKKRSPKNTS